MHESYEKERRRLLRACREERERIIIKQAAAAAGSDRCDGVGRDRWNGAGRDKWGGAKKLSTLQRVREIDTSSSKSKDGRDSDERTGPGQDVEHRQGIRRISDSDGSRSTCNADNKERNRLKVDKSLVPSLGLQLERLTRDIRREMSVTVPDRDRKIAALMLLKHQEEQTRLTLRQLEEQERQEARR